MEEELVAVEPDPLEKTDPGQMDKAIYWVAMVALEVADSTQVEIMQAAQRVRHPMGAAVAVVRLQLQQVATAREVGEDRVPDHLREKVLYISKLIQTKCHEI